MEQFNKYISQLDLKNKILLVSICDEGSVNAEKLNYRYFSFTSFNLKFREGLCIFFDKENNDLQIEKGKTATINKKYELHEINVFSAGYTDNDHRGDAFFKLDGKIYRVLSNRGHNICIIDKKTFKVIDLFSVDTFGDEYLYLNRCTEDNINTLAQHNDLKAMHILAKRKKNNPDTRDESIIWYAKLAETSSIYWSDLSDLLEKRIFSDIDRYNKLFEKIMSSNNKPLIAHALGRNALLYMYGHGGKSFNSLNYDCAIG